MLGCRLNRMTLSSQAAKCVRGRFVVNVQGKTTGQHNRSMVSKRKNSTNVETDPVEPPTRQQLYRVFSHAAVPMIGFGIMDQTVMIQAGNAIDCTIGVLFGLSTLSAAAIGQICSDASGVVFGGTVERLAHAAGLPSANLTAAQSKLPIVTRTTWAGGLFGIIMGCTIGLVNLLFIDTSRSSTLKLQALNEGQDFEFTVEASNALRPDATALTVQGPDVDGVLASMTTALSKQGCSIVEISAKRAPAKDGSMGLPTNSGAINDIFYVVDRKTGAPFDDDQLEIVARALLEATRTPLRNIDVVHAAVVHDQMDSPLDNSFSGKFKTLERRMSVVRQNSEEKQPSGLTRRITVVRHLPKEEQGQEDDNK